LTHNQETLRMTAWIPSFRSRLLRFDRPSLLVCTLGLLSAALVAPGCEPGDCTEDSCGEGGETSSGGKRSSGGETSSGGKRSGGGTGTGGLGGAPSGGASNGEGGDQGDTGGAPPV